ncbi:MAG: helix-turn-helix transcriptional regulator [Chloroflexi bacterium]|nr:helix-turn-helix transcriptional regulator [Chloroflexota bacterium]
MTTVDTRQQLLESLKDTEFRKAFAADIGTGLAFQIRLLREKRGWTQEELARRAGKRQETISQWENPDYGRYTLSTLMELANAFDVGIIVRFAAFSELVDWTVNLSPERLAPPSFEEERQLSFASVGQDPAWAP